MAISDCASFIFGLGRDAVMKPNFSNFGYLCSTIVGIVSVFVVFGLILHSSYVATEQLAIQTSSSIGALVEQDITRNIEILDLSLRAVRDGVGNPEVMALSPKLRQITLFDRSAAAPNLGSILVLDENGNVVLDSRSMPPPHRNLADRDYFYVHRVADDLGLYVSQPYQSRLRGGDWSIAISRRLSHRDGRFAGVISAGISLSYFQGLLQKADFRKDSAGVLFHESGRFLARYPAIPGLIGQKAEPTVRLFQHYGKSAPTGTYEANGRDGVHRLYSYRKIGALPLILNVGLSTDEIFAGWWRQACTTAVSLLALCVLVLVMTLRVGRELRHRRQAEQALSTLAATDPMTGLANRRRFDEVLASEWTRAHRNGTSVCLLMIDVDYFKAFNDRFGHQAGDEVLKAVAATLTKYVEGPPDLAARYGGEEFVVLMPDNTEEVARRLAEALRAAVAETSVPNLARSACKLTVSIGVACRYARESDEAWKLVSDADRALYVAKASGRNRVSCATTRLALVTKSS